MGNIGSGLSTLLNRLSWTIKAGLQFGGKRNLYATFGYKTELTFQDFIIKYVRQGIATRIINAPVISTWNPLPKAIGPEDLVTSWNTFAQKQQIWGIITRTDKLAGLGRYATILIGYNDILKVADLNKPVKYNAELKVLYMQPYSEAASVISEFVTDPTDPRFGLPLYYDIKLIDPKVSARVDYIPTQLIGSTAEKVHWSRIVHISEGVLEDQIFGIPRLMPIYNDLDDLLKVAGGSAEIFWLNARSGMQIDVDKDMELDVTDAADLQDEIEEYQHELRRVIRTKGVKINNLGANVADPTGTVDVILNLIAANTGIPKAVLIGMPMGQLASTQDRANYATLIENRRTDFAEPCMLVPLIQALQYSGVLPKGIMSWTWKSAFRLSPLEEGQTRAQMARSAVNLQKALNGGGMKGGGAPAFITPQEARAIIGFPMNPSDKPDKPFGV